jgi:hypothetical protein
MAAQLELSQQVLATAEVALAERLDATHVSNDRLMELLRAEVRMQRRLGSGLGVPEQVRDEVSQWLLYASVQHRMSQNSYLKALQFFDAFCSASTSPPHHSRMLAIAIAAFRVVQKFESARADDSNHLHTTVLSARMLSRALGIGDVEAVTIREAEVELLHTLAWDIHGPTVETFVSMFKQRFCILTGFHLQNLEPARKSPMCGWLRLLTQATATNSRLPPLAMASGLLCLGLVSQGVLPSHVFGDVRAWRELEQLPLFSAPSCASQNVSTRLAALELATLQPRQELSAAFLSVVMAFKELADSDRPFRCAFQCTVA